MVKLSESGCTDPVSSFAAVPACLGSATSFTDASTNLNTDATYAWDIDNDGTTDYTTKGSITHTYATAGTYTAKLTVTQSTCSHTYTQQVTVNALPTATLSGGGAICPGGSSTLSVALTGTGPWSLTYTDGTTTVPVTGITASPYSITVGPGSTTSYSLLSVLDASCSGTVSGSATVTVNSATVVKRPLL